MFHHVEGKKNSQLREIDVIERRGFSLDKLKGYGTTTTGVLSLKAFVKTLFHWDLFPYFWAIYYKSLT